MKTYIVLAVVASLAAVELRAQSFSDDFNTAGTVAANYNVFLNSTTPLASPYSEVATGGLANSGAVSMLPGGTGTTVTQDATLIRKDTIFDFSKVGITLSISSMLNVSTQANSGNRLLQLGFVNDSTAGMNGNDGLAFVSLRLSSISARGQTYTPQYQAKLTAGTSTSNTSLTPNVTLTMGNWYQLSGSFLNLGGGQVQASGVLQDFGTDGLTAGAVVFTFPLTTLTGGTADITADSTVYAALRGFKNDGLNMVDNFKAETIVPEPGTAALLLLGLAGFAIRRRS